MKRIALLAVVLAAAVFSFSGTPGERMKVVPLAPSPTKDLMREKLAHAQSALEGIAMEDFPLIAKQARKLRVVSQQSEWPAFNNPEYLRYLDSFRHHVDALAKAADERNLDGVTLAYVKVTMSCVECHKFVRGKKSAGLESDLNLPSSLWPKSLGNPIRIGGGS